MASKPSCCPFPFPDSVLDEHELLEALRAKAAQDNEYDILGFLGHRDESRCVFLARELATGSLVALQLAEDGAGEDGYPMLSVQMQSTLDSSVPDDGALCSGCRTQLRPWARFCHRCGTDVSGTAASSGPLHSREALLAQVRARADSDGTYEVLGDMMRAEGGGLVYFARAYASGKLVAFRLDREPDERYSLNMTRVIKPPVRRQSSQRETRQISLKRTLTDEERRIIDEARRLSAEPRGAVAEARPDLAKSVEQVAPPPAKPTRDAPPSPPADHHAASQPAARPSSALIVVGAVGVLVLIILSVVL